MLRKVKKEKMNFSKCDLQWSPTASDLFLTFNSSVPSDLTLFQVGELDEGDLASNTNDTKAQSISSKLNAWPIGSLADFKLPSKSDIKCYACQPKNFPGANLVTLGMSSGKVLLSSFDHESLQVADRVEREFHPKHNRPCHILEWNTLETHRLLAGYDKYRGDQGVALWDINQEKDKSRKMSGMNDGLGGAAKPLAEFGSPGENVHSIKWLNNQATCFVAGIGTKHIRLYDIRDSSRSHGQVTTKLLYGIAIDPCTDYRFSSCVDSQMNIWDLRKLDRSIHNITEPRSVVKVAWCPTRYNRLACLIRDSSVVKIYSIEHLYKEDMEHNEMHLQTNGGNQVASFAWHPTHENCILSITPSGILKETVVADLIPMTWSPQSSLLIGSGRYLQEMAAECADDISTKIKARALRGYGLKKEQIWENGELVGDETLRKFWLILDHIKSLHKEKGLQKIRNNPFYGVKDLIAGEIPGTEFCLRSKQHGKNLEGTTNSSNIHIYTSQERTISMRLCNWDFQNPTALEIYITRLIENGEFERAAAIHMFNLNLRKAIETLNLGSTSSRWKKGDVNLSAIAMALSGYDSSRKNLWCEMCSLLCKQLQNPYLMAMFTFLTCDDGNYSVVLDEDAYKMSIQDRIAFACIFLNDSQLSKYIKRWTEEAMNEGDLDGILLTGLTEDGIKLLASYIDKTADVQTASLVAVLAFPWQLTRDPIVQNWIDCYRNLLDTWRLWHERAKFDSYVQQESTRKKQELQQIFVTCHFCQSPVSPSPYIHHVQASRNARVMEAASKDSRVRMSTNTCHNNKCRKPLPRCCLCLMHMGTDSFYKEKFDTNTTKSEKKKTVSNNWFTWCQSCRHGGHSHHLKEWFSGHVECPVTSCTCRCMLMDSVGSISSVVTS
ncbi:GATOR2 complex protein MIOS-like isoform X2 [Antedon mediterranea]